jgi:hypothetical protein
MQEGTFWRVSLWRAVGGVNPNYKRASDALLWMRFASLESVFTLDFPLGRYSFRPGQLGENKEAYYLELDEIISQQTNALSDDLGSFKLVWHGGLSAWTIQATRLPSPDAPVVEARRKRSMGQRLAISVRKRLRKLRERREQRV